MMILTACGGGGDSSSGEFSSSQNINTQMSYNLTIPSKISASPLTGSSFSPASGNDYGWAIISLAAGTESGYDIVYNAADSSSFLLYSTSHHDAQVINSWGEGWNGFGVNISIIDDFLDPITVSKFSPIITATKEEDNGRYGKVKSTHSLILNWSDNLSHGAMVSNIAGGSSDGQTVTSQKEFVVYSDNNQSCLTLRNGDSYSIFGSSSTWDCDSNYYKNTYAYPAKKRYFNIRFNKVAGIAKSANVINNNVSLSSRQDPIKTVADIQGHLQNSASLGVVNLSLGSDIPTSGKTFNQVMAEVSKFPLTKTDSVFTVAAGNGGAPCATNDLNGCNSIAVALAFQAATSASTIVVGALSGTGSSENIATYSTRAGNLAERFVLASGDEGSPNISGTSFAAPRVAGIAAILRQKYPSLTSAQISNIILLSASKDINNDGFDDFQGVSPIYGHGKVSLTRALNLVNSM